VIETPTVGQTHIAVHALMMLLYNVSPDLIAGHIYGSVAESYLKEKTAAIRRSPHSWYGFLDGPNQRKLAELALERYGHTATEYVNFCEDMVPR